MKQNLKQLKRHLCQFSKIYCSLLTITTPAAAVATAADAAAYI